MELEEICNPVTMRILRYILREGQANITRLARDLGVHHRVIRKHMERLVEKGIVEERVYGRMRLYLANLKDPKVAALKLALEDLEEIVSSL